jgi:phage terminase small subunit
MGKGRKPKPPALRVLDGTRSRWLGETATMGHGIAPGSPIAPAHLDDDARACWDQLVAEFASCGLLERVDAVSLSGLCEAFAIRARAYEKGDIRTWRGASEVVNKLAPEFGMTPSSRAKVHPNKKAEPDALEAFRTQA